MTALPPLLVGGLKLIVAWLGPGVAVPIVGGPGGVMRLNVAVSEVGAVNVRLQIPAVQLAPDQPLKTEPAAGVAVKVNAVLKLNDAEQVAPQLIPAGTDTTVPVPVPDLVMASASPLMLNVTDSVPVPPVLVAETSAG